MAARGSSPGAGQAKLLLSSGRQTTTTIVADLLSLATGQLRGQRGWLGLVSMIRVIVVAVPVLVWLRLGRRPLPLPARAFGEPKLLFALAGAAAGAIWAERFGFSANWLARLAVIVDDVVAETELETAAAATGRPATSGWPRALSSCSFGVVVVVVVGTFSCARPNR